MPNLRVGDLAERTGIKVSAIRYYEEIGLIPAAVASRVANGSITSTMSSG
jgi:DNA-binding transcriptional MerR regulator